MVVLLESAGHHVATRAQAPMSDGSDAPVGKNRAQRGTRTRGEWQAVAARSGMMAGRCITKERR